MNQIQKAIENAQTAAGFTDQQLAEKIGVARSTLRRWKNGRQTSIRIYNLMKICKATGTVIEIDEFGVDVRRA